MQGKVTEMHTPKPLVVCVVVYKIIQKNFRGV